jgi:hypothetical protein
MTQAVLVIGFQGWMNAIFGSTLTYLLLGVFFAGVLVLMSFYLRSSKSPKPDPKDADRLNSCQGSGDCESKLLSCLESLGGDSKTVLLAAAGLDCLPVTVPIRIAILSSEKNKRCLLIDLDTKRDAVWKSFGPSSPSGMSAFAAPSGIRNLSIVPAHYFEQNKQMNIASIARNIQKQYDLILINAPYLDGHPDRKMIASSARYAFVFANEPAQADRLAKLCAASRCKILGCYKMQKNGIPSASGSAQ